MRITKWHPGKLIILWLWGTVLAVSALIGFLVNPIAASPLLHLIALLVTLLILAALSGITWTWLSGRELDI